MFKKTYHKKFYIKLLFYLLSFISFFISGYLIYSYFLKKNALSPWIRFKAINVLNNATNKLNANFINLELIASSLSKELSNNSFSNKEIELKLKNILSKDKSIYSIGVAYEPYAYSKDQELYASYYVRSKSSKSNVKPIKLQKNYNYTKKEWYKDSIKKGSHWTEPYFDDATNSYLIGYSAPIYKDKKIIGSVIVNYNLKQIRDLVSSLDLGSTGYGYIISNSGVYISHPINSYIKNNITIFDMAKKINSSKLFKMAKVALKEYAGDFKYNDKITNQDTWVFYKKVPVNNWTLFVNFTQQEFLEKENQVLYKHLIIIIVALVISLFIFSLTIVNIHSVTKLWIWSIFISIVLLLAIGIIWYLQIYRYSASIDRIIVYDKSTAQEVISDNVKNPIEIPTGILIRHINFEDLRKVNLVGSLWQNYDFKNDNKDRAKDLEQGFIFSDATGDIDKSLIVDHSKSKSDVFKTWNFSAKIYQDFDYYKFPFDYKYIRLHIKPLSLAKNIVLVPDFNAYPSMSPSSLPGISPDLKVYGWNLSKSYFSYKLNKSIPDRVNKYLGERNIPQLYYNIVLQRTFLDVFIANIIPLLLALIFLFFVLRSVVIGKIEEPIKVGTILSPLGMIISLFFAVILAHLSLRGTLSGQPLFYLEYFYIIAYFIMFAILLVVFLIIRGKDLRFIKYKNSILPQILYWPLFLSLSFIVTVSFFYN